MLLTRKSAPPVRLWAIKRRPFDRALFRRSQSARHGQIKRSEAQKTRGNALRDRNESESGNVSIVAFQTKAHRGRHNVSLGSKKMV